MKMTTFTSIVSLTALAAGAACLLSGCASSANYNQADKTGQGIADYRAAIAGMKTQADATLKSLDQIETAASTNPRSAFEQYRKNVAALEKAIAKSRDRGQAMREKGDTYFSRWDNQSTTMKNPEIKQLADQRKAELRDAFDRIKKTSEPLNARLDPWVSDLKDIQNYLGNDLTIAGVAAAKKLFAKARADGADVNQATDSLMAELNSTSATLTPARVPEQPASKSPAPPKTGS